jgi:hypothetical protein
MDWCLVVPDTHIPFEDQRAFELMLQICRSLKIRIIIILGDFIDCYGLSFYDKDPSFGDLADLWEREIDCARKRIDQLERLGAGLHVYLEGNHENRLDRTTFKAIPSLRRRLSVPTELNLANWRWIPFDGLQNYQIPGTDIYCRHCPPAGGGIDNVAKQAGASILFGHDHSVRESDFVSKISHKRITAAGCGWLGDEAQPVFKYPQRKPNWGLAFRLVDEYGGIHLIRINKKDDKYFAVFGSQIFWG